MRGSAPVQKAVAVPAAERIGQGMPFASRWSATSTKYAIATACFSCRRSVSISSEQWPS